jgi:putative nucleotidyltransferase with HDIG domain
MKDFIKLIIEHRLNIYKVLLFLSAIVLLVIIFPKEGKFKYEFQKGRPWMHNDLIASFDFAILKPEEEIDAEKQRLISQVKPYFIFKQDIVDEKYEKLVNKFETDWNVKYTDSIGTDELKKSSWEKCESLFEILGEKGIIELVTESVQMGSSGQIILVKGNEASTEELVDVFTIQTAHDFLKKELGGIDNIDTTLVLTNLEDALFRNIVFNAEKTKNAQDEALENISITRGMVQRGERIISKGELVTAEKFMILESVRRENETQLGSQSSYFMILLGLIILITTSIVVLFFFIMYFRKDIFKSNKKIALILLLIIMMVYITSLVIKYNAGYLYIVPICIIPIIIRAFFDTRPALYVHIITIIIIGFLVPNSFEFVFSQLIAGIIAIISVVHLQRRAQFFLSSLMIFITYSAIYTGLGLMQEGSILGLDWKYYLLFCGSAVLTLFSYPLIYLLEKMFGLITDVTLIELSNTNTKLLRELSEKAPGTFQHSMQVANLAEEILFEIGGNTLLARTGALYHDIGKMEAPAYFTENQQSGKNPHDKLTPDQSAKVIVRHIRRGIEIARKHNLPVQIIDFIKTHQGNRKVEYFFKMKLKNTPEKEINQKLYTYPGPIPNSRETAVVMMADSVEAASKSLKEVDEKSIHELVERIIENQIEAKQFIHANITFREITRIKETLKKKLLNVYHQRIDYPK